MKSLLEPDREMEKREYLGVCSVVAAWISWSIFAVSATSMPELWGLLLAVADGLFAIAFLLLFPAIRRRIHSPADSLLPIIPLTLAAILCLLSGAVFTVGVLPEPRSLPFRFLNLFFFFVILTGLTVWNCLDILERLDSERGRRGAGIAANLLVFMLLPSIFGGATLGWGLLWWRKSTGKTEKRRNLRNIYWFATVGTLLFWSAVWMHLADFSYTAVDGIRYYFSGFWMILPLIAFAFNVWMLFPLPFLLFKRFGWPVTWTAMTVCFLAFGVWGVYENRPERYFLEDFGETPGPVHIEMMRVINAPPRKGGGVAYVLSGDINRLADALVKRHKLKFNPQLPTSILTPRMEGAKLPACGPGWEGGWNAVFVFPDSENQRLYVRVFR